MRPRRCLDDSESECPLCSGERHELSEQAAAEAIAAEKHEQFFDELKHADDGFDVVCQQLGRNIFNSLVVIDSSANGAPREQPRQSEVEQRAALMG